MEKNGEIHISAAGNARREEPARRYRRAYSCVTCQTTHYEFDPIFDDHIMHQSKHGWYFVGEDYAPEPAPKFTVCVSVGGVVKVCQLTRAEIDDAWRTIQASALPQTFVGWYDERDKWTQLGTKPAKF